MFPSAGPARATRTLALVALLVVAVAAVALHTDAAAAAGGATAGRLASRFARPAAAASAHPPTQTDVDRRFKPQWAYYPGNPVPATFPACTSELTGATHLVISAEQWSRIDFSPSGADNPCDADGGFVTAYDGPSASSTCQAKCKTWYINSDASKVDDISQFKCTYELELPGPDQPGQLSGGPQCSALLTAGLVDGQVTAQGDIVSFHLALENSATVASNLVIGVDCPAPHAPSAASLTIPLGQSQSNEITLTIGGNAGGSCTFSYTSGDPRFIGWTKTINFVGATLTPSLSGGSTVLTGSVNSLVLTASSAVADTLTTDVRCTDSADAEVGTLATTFSFANGDTSKTLVYTMPPQLAVASITVTCKFTAAVSGDSRYNNFAIPDLVFTLARQTLVVSGVSANQVLDTNSQTTLTLTASAAPSGPLTVTPTCSAGTLSAATFVINSGSSTATLTFTAPAVKTSDISCTFALTAPTDDRFVGIAVAPLAFSVDLPIAVTLAAANPFITGDPGVNTFKMLFSRAVQGEVQMVLNGGVVSITSGTSVDVPFDHGSAQPGDLTPETFWTYGAGSTDTRYVGARVTLAPRPIVAASAMTLTPTAATGSAKLIGGRQSEMSVTLSYAAYGSLLLKPECKDGAAVVGSFSPSRVSFVDGATVASVNFTAPTSNVASLVCSFTYESGDYRYSGRSASLVPLQVLMPSITLSGTVNGTALIGGDSLFVGDMVVLTVTVDPATNSALVLRSIRNGVAWGADLTIDSGATTIQPGYPLMEAENSEWSFAYKSGDDRFAGLSSNSLSYSAVLTTLTLGGVTNGSAAAASSVLFVTLTASHAVRDEDVVVHISCDGGAVPSGSFRVHVGATLSTVTEVTLPAAAAAPTTVTCSLWFDRGDYRYSYSSAPSFFVVVPAAEPAASSSSSTGDSGSSTATGTGTTGTGTDAGTSTGTATSTGTSTGGASGSASSSSSSSSGGDSQGASSSTAKNGCDDIECAATAQANSGLAFLALAAAAAFALRH